MEPIKPIEPSRLGMTLEKLIRDIDTLIMLALAVPATTLAITKERTVGNGIGDAQDTQATNIAGHVPADSSAAGLRTDCGEADKVAGAIEGARD